jgi:hypothetical protein
LIQQAGHLFLAKPFDRAERISRFISNIWGLAVWERKRDPSTIERLVAQEEGLPKDQKDAKEEDNALDEPNDISP